MPLNTEALDDLVRNFQVAKETRDGDGNLTSFTTVPEREPFKRLPNSSLVRRSTLVDAEGNVIQSWQIEHPSDKAKWDAVQEAIKELHETLPRCPTIDMPTNPQQDWMVGFPVGDHHMGMLAWKHEVGASYDLDIGEQLLASGTDYLINCTPSTEHALIAFLGDFVHYDSMIPETPKGRNPLDGDGRAAKMVRGAMRSMRRMIEKVAEKHAFVHVIIEFGNHDPFSSLWLMEAMRIKYEDNPRITIDCNPGAYHYYQFGKNLIATHHGDQAKMERLPGIVAADRPELWGQTTNRVVWTGHIHSLTARDYPGCTVESFRILPPADAWAHMKGHRPRRDMKAIVFHRGGGECARVTYNPELVIDG